MHKKGNCPTVAPKNHVLALKFFSLAGSGDSNHGEAQLNVARMYHKGNGTKKNSMKAVSWYIKASKNNISAASYRLGVMYKTGEDFRIQANINEAFYWFKRAAEQGHNKSRFILGNLYRRGLGTTQDINKAIFWYKMASEGDHKKASRKLSIIYYRGFYGVPIDIDEAVKWYRRAYNVSEQEALNRMYREFSNISANDTIDDFYFK